VVSRQHDPSAAINFQPLQKFVSILISDQRTLNEGAGGTERVNRSVSHDVACDQQIVDLRITLVPRAGESFHFAERMGMRPV
jgi:hypothetical protein